MARTLPQLESHLEDSLQHLSVLQKRQIQSLEVEQLHALAILQPGEEKLLINSTVFKYDSVRQRIHKLNREERIKAQMEFWLSHDNLQNDAFLQKQLHMNGGWIPISVFLGFKRFSSQNIQEYEIINSVQKSYLIRLDDSKKLVAPLNHVEKISRVLDTIAESDTESENHYIIKDMKENGFLTIQKVLQNPVIQSITSKAEDIIQALKHTKNFRLSKKQTIKPPKSHKKTVPLSSQANNNNLALPNILSPQQVHGLTKERVIILCRRYLSECFLHHPRSPTQAAVSSRLFLAATYPQRAALKISDIQQYLVDIDTSLAAVPVQDLQNLIEQSEVHLKFVNGMVTRTKPITPPRLMRMIEVPTSNSFSVMTYNVLADIMCSKKEFPNSEEFYLNWENRLACIYRQLQYHSPDILLLQEIQVSNDPNQNLWDKHWKPFLSSFGYFHYASEKKASRPTLNVGIAWKTQTFDVVDRKWIKIAEILGSYENPPEGLVEELSSCAHVLVYALLKHKTTQQHILVASTHLSSNPATPHIQTCQAQLCLRYLEHRCKEVASKIGGYPAVVLGGDLNSKPETSVYHLIEATCQAQTHPSNLPYFQEHPNWQLPWGHTLQLASASKVALGEEPLFTHWVTDFQGTLDYIWYSPNLKLSSILDMIPALKDGDQMPNSYHPSDHFPLMASFHF